MNLLVTIPYTALVTLLIFGVSWLISGLDRPLGFASFSAPILLVSGLGITALAFMLRVWTMETFHRHRLKVFWMGAQDRLFPDGPFRFSRNPLYVSSVCMYIGAALVVGSPLALVFAFGSIVFWHAVIVFYEEPSLRKHFGTEYASYSDRVPRWLGSRR